jgi:dinuclear metal center YbgI/SA1388 family protein
MQLSELCQFLENFAPARLAEDWDNVGLLVGDPQQAVRRVMTCLTITPASAAEAVREKVDVIITHHPLPFRPLKQLTTAATPGRLLLDLIRAGIAIHSPHTAFDSALTGINQRLAEGLGLQQIQPLVPNPRDAQQLGSGRFGRFGEPKPLAQVAEVLKRFLNIATLQAVGNSDQLVTQAAVACGSAGSFLQPAMQAGCELLVTGETTFHTCLEAEASGVALLLPGHYASERFAVERLAEVLALQFPALNVFASRNERDPLQTL